MSECIIFAMPNLFIMSEITNDILLSFVLFLTARFEPFYSVYDLGACIQNFTTFQVIFDCDQGNTE